MFKKYFYVSKDGRSWIRSNVEMLLPPDWSRITFWQYHFPRLFLKEYRCR